MKLKLIVPVCALFVSSLALVSCGGKGSKDGSASAKTHAEVGQGMAALMNDMAASMSKIKDVPSAEAFAASVPDIKARMKALHTAAMALPAPTDAEKAAVSKMMDESQEKAGPVIMEAMMGLGKLPDAEAIAKIMENAMKDEEMDKMGDALEDLYKSGGSEGPDME